MAVPLPVHARTVTFYRAGGWSAFGGRADDGQKVCGILASDMSTGRFLTIKYFNHARTVTFQLLERGWEIPGGTSIPVMFRIDRDPVWTATGVGSGNTVQWAIDPAELDNFELQFRSGSALRIVFLRGNEPPWTAILAGSTEIDTAFRHCVALMLRSDRPAGPFSQSPSAPRGQPFDRKQQPSTPPPPASGPQGDSIRL